MNIKVNRFAIVEEYLPPHSIIEYEGIAKLGNFLDFIDRKYGPGINKEIIQNAKIKEEVVILLNGRSIKTYPHYVDISIKDKDVITIGILICGG